MNVFSLNAVESADLSLISLKNVNQAYPNIITGGQPSVEDLTKLKAMGVKTIVNLRTSGEFNGYNEASEASKLGVNYISLEISGNSGITLENAKKFDQILNKLEGKALVHCASSNRVGALFALRAALIQGKSSEEAIIEGKRAGLKSLQHKVETLINN